MSETLSAIGLAAATGLILGALILWIGIEYGRRMR